MSSRNISMRRREFACARLSSPYMTRSLPRLFHNAHHRGLATEAAYGCLKPPPAGRLRRAHLHLSYSTALACLHDTNSHQFLPITRAEVSSEHTTLLAVTTSRIVAAAASSGSRARASRLLIAPSLIDSENNSSINRLSRSRPMAWA